jgi:acetyltransferase
MFGLGGIYVETFKDVSFRSAPINVNDAEEMIGGLKSSPILFGVRGEKRKDLEKIVDTLLKLSKLISCCEEVTDVEINPLVVKEEGKGVKALDVRILLKKEVKK